MSAPILSLEGLTIGYGRRVVGAGLSLACEQGQALALLGPNGSGKTTLFKTILGLIPPLTGRVLVGGEDTRHWAPRRRARILGYVPQSSPGYFPFTMREMVMMGRTARLGALSAPSESDRAVAREVIARLGIGRLAERSYTELSGGERQLVLIARALAQEPQILILDEPTASLDFGNQIMVVETVRQLVAEGLTVVLATHHPEQAFACTHLAALIKDGALASFGPTAETLTGDALSALYDTPLAIRIVDGWASCVPRLRRPVTNSTLVDERAHRGASP